MEENRDLNRRLIKLHQRLTTKHHETFWIEVENAIHDNKEYFCYKQIEHTRNPQYWSVRCAVRAKSYNSRFASLSPQR